MLLNSTFASNIRAVYGKAGDLWLKELPTLIQQLSDQWGFRFLRATPDLTYNFIGQVEMNTNAQPAIIKIAPSSKNLAIEVKWLNFIKKSVPKVYVFDEKYNAFLMEQLQPGVSLKSFIKTNSDEEATRIICQTIRDLQANQRSTDEFPHISELAKALPILANHFDNRLLSQAQTWFHELSHNNTQDVVLHGDLHHDNILSSNSDWKAIDPHGYIGDPAAEVGAMIRNPIDCFPNEYSLSKTVEKRLQIMADELPFDRQRIKCWAFCMTVLSAAWTFEDHGHLKNHDIAIALAIDQAKV